jgi:hypothetical protein
MKARHLIVVVSAISILVSPRCFEAAELLVHFDMEQSESPLLDTVSQLAAEEEEDGHLYLQPGPPGFGNAVALTEDGAWNMNVEDSAVLRDLENDFTVAAWVYVDSDAAANKFEVDVLGSHRILGDNNAWDGDGWGWGVQVDGRLLFTKNGIVDASTLDSYVVEDEWTHVAVTVSSDDGLHYFVNGEDVETVEDFADIIPSPGQNGEDDWWGVGRTNLFSGEQWFAGRLDEVRVYSDVLTEEEIAALLVPTSTPGDFDNNGQLNVEDVNLLTQQIATGGGDLAFDLNADNAVTVDDLTVWVKDLKNTWIGDANLDQQFNTADLVAVLSGGEYEDSTAGNSVWSTGDWNADGEFNSSDLVAALADGGYEAGPRAAAQAVPEPNGLLITLLALPWAGALHRSRRFDARV